MSDATAAPFANRLAVVTGASRGIGRALARALGQGGAQVVALARTVGGLEELDDEIRRAGGPGAVLVPHDLAELDHIDLLGASLYERFGRVDILVAAAAQLGALSPVGHLEPKLWGQVMTVNLNANQRLLRSLDPLLRQSDGGRVVLIGDAIAQRAPAYWGAYAASKAALETLGLCYGAEVERSQVRCNVFCPTPTATALRAQAFPGEDSSQLPGPDQWTESVLPLLLDSCTKNREVLHGKL